MLAAGGVGGPCGLSADTGAGGGQLGGQLGGCGGDSEGGALQEGYQVSSLQVRVMAFCVFRAVAWSMGPSDSFVRVVIWLWVAAYA